MNLLPRKYIDMVFGRLRKRKKEPEGPQIARSEFLQVKPLRNPELKWEKDEEGKITIILPLTQPKETPEEKETKEAPKPKRRKIKFFPEFSGPRQKKFQLDDVGSIVWDLCDGKNTMKDIVEYLNNEYKLLPSEAETSLNAYFNQLAKRKLLVFVLPDEASARLREQREREAKKKQ
jgi:hypothetical protein